MTPRPAGHLSVMTDKAPAIVLTDDARTSLYRKLEYFPSPPFAFRALGEILRALDPPLPGSPGWAAWECACGEGHGAYGLKDYFRSVISSDIHDHGAGLVHDFLGEETFAPAVDWVVTNPPFGLAAQFVARGLRHARRGVAMLCRSGWRETAGRYGLFYGPGASCDLELPFFDRVNMNLGRWVVKSTAKGGSSATPYSWFVWFKPEAKPLQVAQAQAALRAMLPMFTAGVDGPVPGMGPHGLPSIGIPPGTKARLTGPDDAPLFGWRDPVADLLSGVADPPGPRLKTLESA